MNVGIGIDSQVGGKRFAHEEINAVSEHTGSSHPASNDDGEPQLDIVGGKRTGGKSGVGVVDLHDQPGVGIPTGTIRDFVRAEGVHGVAEVPPAHRVIGRAVAGTGDEVVRVGGSRPPGEDAVGAQRPR